tara:strand:- start:421 stop:1521 length:1101 start_codon:yes stop_codon:yes gene_type:complete
MRGSCTVPMLPFFVRLLLLAGPLPARGMTVVEEEWENTSKGGPEGEWNWVEDKQQEQLTSTMVIVEDEDSFTNDGRVATILSAPQPAPVVDEQGNLDAAVTNLVREGNKMHAATVEALKRALAKVSDGIQEHPVLRVIELTESIEFMRLELERRIDFWDKSAAVRNASPSPSPLLQNLPPDFDSDFDYDYEYHYDTKAVAAAIGAARDATDPYGDWYEYENDYENDYDTKAVAAARDAPDVPDPYEYEYHYDVGWLPRETLSEPRPMPKEEYCVFECKQDCYLRFCDAHCSSGVCFPDTTYRFNEAVHQRQEGKYDAQEWVGNPTPLLKAESSAYNYGYDSGYDAGYENGYASGYEAARVVFKKDL